MAEELPHEEQAPLPRGREAVDWWLKKWGRSEPLTREDVQHLIKVNGGTANELALSRRTFRTHLLVILTYGARGSGERIFDMLPSGMRTCTAQTSLMLISAARP